MAAFSARVECCEARHTGHSLPIRRLHIAGPRPAAPSGPGHVLPGGTGRAGRGVRPQAPETGDVPRGGRHRQRRFPLQFSPFGIPLS